LIAFNPKYTSLLEEITVIDTEGVLYVVATPIGNLEDISLRAQRILTEVDVILAEDTRHSKVLLEHLGISTPMQSYHDHNEAQSVDKVINMLGAGKQLALISDAGTPLISDPGYRLVSSLVKQGISVISIPGPSAITASLSISGLATDRFCFEGFLSEKPIARRKQLQALKNETRTLVFFESPHRINALIDDAVAILGHERDATITREITKKFESLYHGSLGDLQALSKHDGNFRKGEIVLIIQGDKGVQNEQIMHLEGLLNILLKHDVSVKQASKVAAEITGLGKNEIYQMAVNIKQND
jgi:16S rRNA (cytidine1402-2'-O)-methyltransferase